MPITLEARAIDFYNLSKILKLGVHADQKDNVAPNSVTIAQNIYEPAGWVRGLWDGDTPIGLIAMINPAIESPSFEEGDPTDAAYLWRLMIDKQHQGKGYGRLAIGIAFNKAREWNMPRFQTSCVPGPHSPQKFYELLGLKPTGRIVEEEVELMGPTPDEI